MSHYTAVYYPELYNLLELANQHINERTILDCGAGGRKPPLGLFHLHGFKTTGIDISPTQIQASEEFQKEHNIDLNIIEGDMLDLQFPDDSFSCVYSFRSSIHLTKKQTKQAIGEMLRVLKTGGVMYIDFIWEPAKQMYLGEERAPGECWMMGRNGEMVLHTVFSEEEADELMEGHHMLLKKKELLSYEHNGEILEDAYIHYYILKNDCKQ